MLTKNYLKKYSETCPRDDVDPRRANTLSEIILDVDLGFCW
jgi:hypothetical protein